MGILEGPAHVAAILHRTHVPLAFNDWALAHGLCPIERVVTSKAGWGDRMRFLPGRMYPGAGRG